MPLMNKFVKVGNKERTVRQWVGLGVLALAALLALVLVIHALIVA